MGVARARLGIVGRWLAIAGFVAACSQGTVPAGTPLPTLRPALPTLGPTAVPAAPTIAPSVVVTAAPTAPPATPAPTPAPTVAPTPVPTVAPTPAPTAPPTRAPSILPSVLPSSVPTASAEGDFPNDAEALLITYVSTDLQDTCGRERQIYDDEVDSVTCGTNDLPFTYTLFATSAAMEADYDADLVRSEKPRDPKGKCADANFEDTYTIDGNPGGRLRCGTHTSKTSGLVFRELEWTNDELLVLGFISNRVTSWADLIEVWSNDAGPFKR